jgi:rubrerythrin
MAIEFSKAVGLVTAITSAAKRLSDTREEVKVNEVAIQLQGIVLDLQSEMMMIQSDYQNILRSKEDLEKKLVEQENWDKERTRYHLKNVGTGLTGFVYALNKSEPSIEPPHWICPNCYEDKKKSILQFTRKMPSSWNCPRCKTEVVITGFPSSA